MRFWFITKYVLSRVCPKLIFQKEDVPLNDAPKLRNGNCSTKRKYLMKLL